METTEDKTPETKVAINPFGSAKATTKAVKKDDKISIVLPESEFAGIGEKAKRLSELRIAIKSDTAEAKMKEEDLKIIATGQFLKLYKKEQRNIGTFVAVCENGVKFNITPADAYAGVDANKAKILTEKYGEGLIATETTYSFNNDVLKRNMDVISKIIMNCTEITDEDKANLLSKTESFSISKGTIDKLVTFGEKIDTIIPDIKPTIQIKF